MTNNFVKDFIESYRRDIITYYNGEYMCRLSMDEFMEQPIDGILYDLNRLEPLIFAILRNVNNYNDIVAWINNLATTQVIRYLYDHQYGKPEIVESNSENTETWD